MSDTLHQKILGGVYGQALGDAFCMPSLITMAETRKRYGRITQFLPGGADHFVHHSLKAGQITDDTEQALWLARQFIADGKVSVEGSAKAIVGWFDAIDGENVPYVGPSTRRAVNKIKAGVDLQLTGFGGDTNGAAMRVSIVGLIHPGDVDAAAHDAALSAIPTHNTSVACASAAAIAGAVAMALKPDAELRDVIFASMHAASIGQLLGLNWLGASVQRRIDLAVSLARDNFGTDTDRLQAIYDLIGTGLAASEAVPAAIAIVSLAEGDPITAAHLSAELSGDADTIGAMACAICGAFKGIDAIPPDMRQTLRNANPDYDFDGIAEGLLDLARLH